MRAASSGHIDVILALLANTAIDVNYANVSNIILNPSHVVWGGG